MGALHWKGPQRPGATPCHVQRHVLLDQIAPNSAQLGLEHLEKKVPDDVEQTFPQNAAHGHPWYLPVSPRSMAGVVGGTSQDRGNTTRPDTRQNKSKNKTKQVT